MYKSKGEAIVSLWNDESGRPIFLATMSLDLYESLCVLQHQSWSSERDKLAEIRDVWDEWVKIVPVLYNPGPHVTVDEHLVPFRGRCPF